MSICQFILQNPIQQGVCKQFLENPCPFLFQDDKRVKQCESLQKEFSSFNFKNIQNKIKSIITIIIILLILIFICVSLILLKTFKILI